MDSVTRRALKYTAVFIGVPVIGLICYGLMHYFAYVFPLAGNSSNGLYLLYTLFVIGLGLAAGYWMLKVAFHAAHIRDASEPELKLSDLPKQQSRLHPGNG